MLLSRHYKDVTKGEASKDMQGISCGLVNENVFEWEVMFMVDDDIKYYGGKFPLSCSTLRFHVCCSSCNVGFDVPFHRILGDFW